MRWLAGAAAAAVGTLLWPGAAGAAPSAQIGGASATVTSAVVHLEVFEPVIPIPASPQGDISLGYTSSSVDSGPTTRALASYLWPGPVIGDGFDQLLQQPGVKYPVQVDSRYPATADAPAQNTAQITDGNGMTTSTDGKDTKASVTGLGIAGPGVNLLGGLGKGLNCLLNPHCHSSSSSAPSSAPSSGSSSAPGTSSPSSGSSIPDVPVPVSSTLAGLLTLKNMVSTTDVTVADDEVTTTGDAEASEIKLLGGLIGLDGLQVQTKIVSNGTKATVTGGATLGAITIAGVKFGLTDKGADAGGSTIQLPKLPQALDTILNALGIDIQVTPVDQSVDQATGKFSGSALTISIDTAPLKKILDGPLNLLTSLLPSSARTQLAPLLQAQPKIVLKLGDVEATESASPAYVPPPTGGTTPPSTGTPNPPVTGGGGANPGGFGTGGITTGTGTGTGTGTLPGAGVPQTSPPAGNGGGGATNPTPVTNTALALPSLATVPRFLILGAIVLAAAIGWALQAAGASLLGGAGACRFGLTKGVPNLRKG